jgi:hypothetical protein
LEGLPARLHVSKYVAQVVTRKVKVSRPVPAKRAPATGGLPALSCM